MSINSLSHPRAITIVPDPIHGKFDLNIFDRQLIDSPFFQRLHHVYQNSANYVSYPSNKNTRFPHSIGVAHVGGMLFSQSLSSASYPVLHAFLKRAETLLSTIIDTHFADVKHTSPEKHPFYEAHFATISGLSAFSHSPILPSDFDENHTKLRMDTEDLHGKQDYRTSFIVDTFWQAIRVYGLMHDLGHFPMSHSFESGLNKAENTLLLYTTNESARQTLKSKVSELQYGATSTDSLEYRTEYLSKIAKLFTRDGITVSEKDLDSIIGGKQLHESRGINLYMRFMNENDNISKTVKELHGVNSDELNNYSLLIHHLTLAIYYSVYLSKSLKEDRAAAGHDYYFLVALRQIVDGSVDADRLDYTLRDTHEAGTHFGTFDLDRIVKNALLIQNKNHINRFNFGFNFRATSGIEQFFEARYQSYKYMVHSRTSARTNSCIERLVSLLFIHSFLHPDRLVANLLKQFNYIEMNGKVITGIAPETGNKIHSIDECSFRSLMYAIHDAIEDGLLVYEEDSTLVEDIHILTKVVLYRDFDHIFTLSKNQPARNFVRDQLSRDLSSEQFEKFYNYMTDDGASREVRIKAIEKLHAKLRTIFNNQSVLLIFHNVKPKLFDGALESDLEDSYEQQVLIQTARGKDENIRRNSAVLEMMDSRNEKDTDLRVYIGGRKIKEDPKFRADFKSEFQYSIREMLHNFEKN